MSEVDVEKEWTPRTSLGKMVKEGKITSIDEIFMHGFRIQEPEIIDALLPDLQQEILYVTIVQKQTDAGEKSRFKVLVVVGNANGYVGIGTGKARQVRTAVEKATLKAKLSIIPVRRGCGHWECGCDTLHSLPFKVVGKCGSVKVELLPAPRGVGLVAGEIAKTILRLCGIKDCWTKSFGSTSTVPSFAYAVYSALRNTYKILTPEDWVGV